MWGFTDFLCIHMIAMYLIYIHATKNSSSGWTLLVWNTRLDYLYIIDISYQKKQPEYSFWLCSVHECFYPRWISPCIRGGRWRVARLLSRFYYVVLVWRHLFNSSFWYYCYFFWSLSWVLNIVSLWECSAVYEIHVWVVDDTRIIHIAVLRIYC